MHVEEERVVAHAGVVHERVERSEAVDHLIDDLAVGDAVAHVGVIRGDARMLLDAEVDVRVALERERSFLRAVVGERHEPAVGEQMHRRDAADAARSAGDQGYLRHGLVLQFIPSAARDQRRCSRHVGDRRCASNDPSLRSG